MQKITPHLWFQDQAEEAAKFYTTIFKDSKIVGTTRYGEAGAAASGRPKGNRDDRSLRARRAGIHRVEGGQGTRGASSGAVDRPAEAVVDSTFPG
jgi:predicted 3-demethylubiquinone-9 3-methyltransferase (glyoxalase superfamily)